MPRRKVDLDTKVQAMRECLHLEHVEATMRKYHLSERAAFNWFAQILERLPDILQNESPGPKRQSDTLLAPPRRRQH
jgi:hypothetical protein